MRRLPTAAGLTLALVLLGPSAHAATGDLGHDVSHAQCSGALPVSGTFGIVGVTSGLPFSLNSCLATEATWAVATGHAELYVNTANPGHTSGHWPTAATGTCVNATVDTDTGCAYEYGKAAAQDAFDQATSALTGTGLDPRTVTWWLDVEGSRTPGQPGNSWVGSGVVNAADLQGFADGLRARGVPEVGVYSTAYQWNDIAEGYTRATSRAYRTSWKPVAVSPLEDGPVWYAGVSTQSDAQNACGTTSFTGGERLLAQYSSTEANGTFDGDYRCADPDVTAPTASLSAPTSPFTLTSVHLAWTGTGAPVSYDVRTIRAPYNGSFQAWQQPSAYQRLLTSGVTVPAPPQGWTGCYSVRSRDAAGNVSSWTAQRCTATPLDDRALSASSGWTRGTGSGWFASTWTSTTRLGATLTRTSLRTKRLALVALRCSTCGKVGVYLGSTRIATVDLYAASATRAVIGLPPFSLRTTTVTLKVLTSGKTVRIDGLGTSQA